MRASVFSAVTGGIFGAGSRRVLARAMGMRAWAGVEAEAGSRTESGVVQMGAARRRVKRCGAAARYNSAFWNPPDST